jgi:hypothetical protein
MSLTELWRASGKSWNYDPTQWKRKEGRHFIAKIQNDMPVGHIVFRTSKGGSNKVVGSGAGGGGTIAHWQIGTEYARYLSPDLAKVCN